jgi:hypothetical protein
MVAAGRRGEAWRAVAARFGVSGPTVTRGVGSAQGQRLDRTACSAQSSAPRHVHHRTGPAMEQLVLDRRQPLRDQRDLGECGAAAIRCARACRGLPPLPRGARSATCLSDMGRGMTGVESAARRPQLEGMCPPWPLDWLKWMRVMVSKACASGVASRWQSSTSCRGTEGWWGLGLQRAGLRHGLWGRSLRSGDVWVCLTTRRWIMTTVFVDRLTTRRLLAA